MSGLYPDIFIGREGTNEHSCKQRKIYEKNDLNGLLVEVWNKLHTEKDLLKNCDSPAAWCDSRRARQ